MHATNEKLHAEKTGKLSRSRRVRFPGIKADAAALGVNRSHLYRVLAGQRPGKSLLAKYHALHPSSA